jgi:hypothetical protein
MYEYFSDFCTIQVWRSFWVVQDFYLFPENAQLSAVLSLTYGIVIYVLLYTSNKHVNKLLVKRPNFMVVRLVILIGFTGSASIWRALWMLQFAYTYPTGSSENKKLIICLISLIVASIIIFLTKNGSCTLSRSCCKDDIYFAKKNYIAIIFFSKFLKPKKVNMFEKN